MSEIWVVDANVLVQGFIEDTQTARVQTLLHSVLFDTEPPILYVPEFCLLECANVLWKEVRFHNKPSAQAQQAIQNLIAFPLAIQPSLQLLPRALAIGLEHALPIYDSVYIALAEAVDKPLITVDEKQATAARSVGVSLKPTSDFAEFKP